MLIVLDAGAPGGSKADVEHMPCLVVMRQSAGGSNTVEAIESRPSRTVLLSMDEAGGPGADDRFDAIGRCRSDIWRERMSALIRRWGKYTRRWLGPGPPRQSDWRDEQCQLAYPGPPRDAEARRPRSGPAGRAGPPHCRRPRPPTTSDPSSP